MQAKPYHTIVPVNKPGKASKAYDGRRMATQTETRVRRITSRSNAQLKELRRAFAKNEPGDDGLVAIEGVRLIEEAIRSGLRVHALFFREPVGTAAERLLEQTSPRTEALAVPEDVFGSAVATESPQGIAALVAPKSFSLEEMLKPADPLILACAGIQDPGNIGTLLRAAEAFSASGALLLEGTASAWNQKTIRAAAGSLFRLPIVSGKFAQLLPRLREKSIRLIAGSSHKAKPLSEAHLGGPLCIVIGNEGAGIPREILREADETVAIPHSPKVESLNAAIAGAVMLYEAARTRQRNGIV